MATKIVGIINCTPDSFSDGTGDVSHERLIKLAHQLLDEGADMLDIGGDSTRPGSTCPGIEEEWRRISPLVSRFAQLIPISVDTHHPEIARRAIESGATFINDVSGQRAPEMLNVIASTQASYIFMCNPHGAAHQFGEGFTFASALSGISAWIRDTIEVSLNAGIAPHRIIVDPGLGAFISSDPRVSWLIAESLGELPSTQGGILLGCSRKGFLKLFGDMDLEAKDHLSARIGAAAVRQVASDIPTYLRVHNVARQREALSGSDSIMPEWRGMCS
jgi:dihydropteroate synthase